MNKLSKSQLMKLPVLLIGIVLCSLSCTKDEVNEITPIGGSERDTLELPSSMVVFDSISEFRNNCFYKSCNRTNEIVEHYLFYGPELTIIDEEVSFSETLNILKWTTTGQNLSNRAYLAQGVELERGSLEIVNKYLVNVDIERITDLSISGDLVGDDDFGEAYNGIFNCIKLSCEPLENLNELAFVYTEGVLNCLNDSIPSTKLCAASFICDTITQSGFPQSSNLIYGGGKMNVSNGELFIEETPDLAIYVVNANQSQLGIEIPAYYLALTEEHYNNILLQGPTYIQSTGRDITITFSAFNGPNGTTGSYQSLPNSSNYIAGNFTSTLFNCQ